uniref:Uncharacterized protein n=1 Tax=Timema cristinae TaxID=61476 RepID=A0A7R9DQP3_TIMCR|nr:unnamed protein product [Timema cristinae]
MTWEEVLVTLEKVLVTREEILLTQVLVTWEKVLVTQEELLVIREGPPYLERYYRMPGFPTPFDIVKEVKRITGSRDEEVPERRSECNKKRQGWLKVIPLDETLKRKRLLWLGHVMRMDDRRPKKALQNKEKGRRPKTRWMDQAQKDTEAKGPDWRLVAEGQTCRPNEHSVAINLRRHELTPLYLSVWALRQLLHTYQHRYHHISR